MVKSFLSDAPSPSLGHHAVWGPSPRCAGLRAESRHRTEAKKERHLLRSHGKARAPGPWCSLCGILCQGHLQPPWHDRVVCTQISTVWALLVMHSYPALLLSVQVSAGCRGTRSGRFGGQSRGAVHTAKAPCPSACHGSYGKAHSSPGISLKAVESTAK